MKLVLCGNTFKKAKTESDLVTEKLDEIIQWSQTVYQNQK